jgi:hypothetical protein
MIELFEITLACEGAMFDTMSIADDVVNRITQHYHHIGQSLAWPDTNRPRSTLRSPTPVHADIARFVQIANGDVDRATVNDQTIGELIERFQNLLDLLFLPANGQYTYRIPATFWGEAGIGQVLARVQAWLRHDDLISFTDAAQLLFPEIACTNLQAARMRVKRLTERGDLMVYRAPDESNPTQQARVSRQAIEALQAAGYGHN